MFVCIIGNKHYWQLFSFITCNGLNIGIYWSKIHGTDSLKPFSFEVKSTEAFIPNIPKKHINNKLYPQVYIVLKEEKNFKQKTQAQHRTRDGWTRDGRTREGRTRDGRMREARASHCLKIITMNIYKW